MTRLIPSIPATSPLSDAHVTAAGFCDGCEEFGPVGLYADTATDPERVEGSGVFVPVSLPIEDGVEPLWLCGMCR